MAKHSARKVSGGNPVTPSFMMGQLKPQMSVRTMRTSNCWRVSLHGADASALGACAPAAGGQCCCQCGGWPAHRRWRIGLEDAAAQSGTLPENLCSAITFLISQVPHARRSHPNHLHPQPERKPAARPTCWPWPPRPGQSWRCCPSTSVLMGPNDEAKLQIAEDDGAGPMQDWLRSRRAHTAYGWWAAVCRRCGCPATPSACSTAAWCTRPVVRAWPATTRFTCSALRPSTRPTTNRACCSAATRPCARLAGRDGHRWRVGLSICYDLRFPSCIGVCCRWRRFDDRASRIHPHHRPGALGAAVAHTCRGKPVRRGGRGARRHARIGPTHLGPQHGRGALGRAPCRRRAAWPWPTWTPPTSRAAAASCQRRRTPLPAEPRLGWHDGHQAHADWPGLGACGACCADWDAP